MEIMDLLLYQALGNVLVGLIYMINKEEWLKCENKVIIYLFSMLGLRECYSRLDIYD